MHIPSDNRPLQARPTLYKGIQMRSRLEAQYAAFLDQWGVAPWQYEPDCFADETGQYLPDFVIRYDLIRPEGGDKRPHYIEVKPRLEPEDIGPIAERMEIILSTTRNCYLSIIAPSPPGGFWTCYHADWYKGGWYLIDPGLHGSGTDCIYVSGKS